jgi:hypothetical protein
VQGHGPAWDRSGRAIPAAGRGVIAFVVDDPGREVCVIAIGYVSSK